MAPPRRHALAGGQGWLVWPRSLALGRPWRVLDARTRAGVVTAPASIAQRYVTLAVVSEAGYFVVT